MKNNISYCLPGGHVELGEDSKTAILREMLEEINTSVSIDKELAIVENFYLDKKNFSNTRNWLLLPCSSKQFR